MSFVIAALARGGVIGVRNALPWRLPTDLRRFKQLTMGHAVIMGRKTYDSIGRPLPGRRIIVVTRQRDWTAAGVTVAHSVDEALALAGEGEVFIAGGAELYAQMIDRADRLYLTLIDADFEGDAHFPTVSPDEWRIIEEQPGEPGEIPHRFVTYERLAAPPLLR
jgi:dihydrofolate reductase